jgi:hypothetical protein
MDGDGPDRWQPIPMDREPNRWAVLALLGVAQLMVVLDATIVTIAIPSAQKALQFSTDSRQRIVTAYALAFGSLLLSGRRLGDLFGRARPLRPAPSSRPPGQVNRRPTRPCCGPADAGHIPSLIPRLISQLFAGYEVKKPRIIPTCMRNQYAAWSGFR